MNITTQGQMDSLGLEMGYLGSNTSLWSSPVPHVIHELNHKEISEKPKLKDNLLWRLKKQYFSFHLLNSSNWANNQLTETE